MKNQIMFYYHFYDIELSKQKDIYFFRYKKDLYSFEKVLDIFQFNEILGVLKKMPLKKYFTVIPNIYHQFLTYINGEYYALFLRKNFSFLLLEEVVYIPQIHLGNSSHLKKPSWDILWSKKIDYYEYQMQSISDLYPIINESFYFYVGMAENAISYVKYNFKHEKSDSLLLFYLCHKRVNLDNLFHPKNFVIDYYSREIAEYLKYLFFSNKYKDISFYKFFESFSFSYNDYILIYSRLIFPSYYFDVYDNIVNNRLQEIDLRPFILRMSEYNAFLNYIHSVICKFVEIPSIEWIKKEVL